MCPAQIPQYNSTTLCIKLDELSRVEKLERENNGKKTKQNNRRG